MMTARSARSPHAFSVGRMISARSRFAYVVAALLCLGAVAPAAGAQTRELGDTRVFARVGEPGMPEGVAVRDGIVYVGTHASVRGNAGEGPSKVFRYDLDTAEKIDEISIEGQTLDETHGILHLAFDGAGRLYVIDRNPPRLLRLDLSGPEPVQETYAEFRDIPPCAIGQLGTAGDPCSATLTDIGAHPNTVAFDADGNAYVTDFGQASIFLVRPGGGEPELWFTDPRLDSALGPNGIAVDPTGTKLYFAMTGSMQLTTPTAGVIYTLPLGTDRPAADDLETFHTYPGLLTAPDGIAFGDSGRLYVVLAGTNQVSVLSPEGSEVLRFPDADANDSQEVPYDVPATLAFDGKGSILVTNQSYMSPNPDNWVVFDAFVDDRGLPLMRPEIP